MIYISNIYPHVPPKTSSKAILIHTKRMEVSYSVYVQSLKFRIGVNHFVIMQSLMIYDAARFGTLFEIKSWTLPISCSISPSFLLSRRSCYNFLPCVPFCSFHSCSPLFSHFSFLVYIYIFCLQNWCPIRHLVCQFERRYCKKVCFCSWSTSSGQIIVKIFSFDVLPNWSLRFSCWSISGREVSLLNDFTRTPYCFVIGVIIMTVFDVRQRL